MSSSSTEATDQKPTSESFKTFKHWVNSWNEEDLKNDRLMSILYQHRRHLDSPWMQSLVGDVQNSMPGLLEATLKRSNATSLFSEILRFVCGSVVKFSVKHGPTSPLCDVNDMNHLFHANHCDKPGGSFFYFSPLPAFVMGCLQSQEEFDFESVHVELPSELITMTQSPEYKKDPLEAWLAFLNDKASPTYPTVTYMQKHKVEPKIYQLVDSDRGMWATLDPYRQFFVLGETCFFFPRLTDSENPSIVFTSVLCNGHLEKLELLFIAKESCWHCIVSKNTEPLEDSPTDTSSVDWQKQDQYHFVATTT
jgi:hypothetical protein